MKFSDQGGRSAKKGQAMQGRRLPPSWRRRARHTRVGAAPPGQPCPLPPFVSSVLVSHSARR
jgi:hypothetical protein